MSKPTCTRCNFDWVRMDLDFTRDEMLCDSCMNQCLGKTWIVGRRVFSTELDAMTYKYRPNPVIMTPKGKIIVKKPILTQPRQEIIDLVSEDESKVIDLVTSSEDDSQ